LTGQIDATFEILQNNSDLPLAGNCGAPPSGNGNYTYGYGYLNVLNAGLTVTPPPVTPPPATPTPSPTPTPECQELGCTIDMPANNFTEGDDFYCTVYVCNPNPETYTAVPVFVILDVYGLYFFAPNFSDFEYYAEDIAPGVLEIEVLPVFTWPGNVGSAEGIVFYAAMTNAAITELFGSFDMFAFGWY